MSDIYVLVHGAWHTGDHFEAVANFIRAKGHTVHCPTLAGNRPADVRSQIGLEDAIASLASYLEAHDLKDVRLVGHSYGGMVITGVGDRMPERIRRLVYMNAFVPNPGDCLLDLVPPLYADIFQEIAKANDGAVVLPFPVWREAFINDADLAVATAAYESLNPHSYATFADKITLSRPVAEQPFGKSYLNCREDTALPPSFGWHPRLSERLGLFRYVETQGSHEALFTQPQSLAEAVIAAGRD